MRVDSFYHAIRSIFNGDYKSIEIIFKNELKIGYELVGNRWPDGPDNAAARIDSPTTTHYIDIDEVLIVKGVKKDES